MSFQRQAPVPRVPTAPKGTEIAAYDTYIEAQQAVDYLSDQKFAVEQLTIVGADLRMVERVTGRMTYGRAAMAGAMSGAWFGFFVGLLLSLFGGVGVYGGIVFVALALGAGFGLLFAVLSYAMTGGRRDFTSQSQIVAATYAVWCNPDSAGEARRLLMNGPNGVGRAMRTTGVVGRPPASPVVAAPDAQAGTDAPSTPGADAPAPEPKPVDSRWTLPDGRPRYGALRPDEPPAQPATASPVVEQGPHAPTVETTPGENPANQPPSDPYAPPPGN